MLSSLYPQMMTYWGWRRRKGASESKDDRTSSQQLRRAYLSLLLLSCQFRLLYSESNLSEYLDSSTCISYMPYENRICCTQSIINTFLCKQMSCQKKLNFRKIISKTPSNQFLKKSKKSIFQKCPCYARTFRTLNC